LPRPLPGRPPSLAARIIRVERWRLRRGGPLPYAVAIASGAFFVLSLGVST
jgi:prepilin peptidase CpaA